MKDLTLSPEQCRGARGILGLSQDQLCELSGVSIVTISDFEGGKTKTYASTLDKLRSALEGAGVEFIDASNGGPGVRLKKAGE